jgi:hypothetical protein
MDLARLAALYRPSKIGALGAGPAFVCGVVESAGAALLEGEDGPPSRCVAYQITWAGERGCHAVPFWIVDESGRALVDGGSLALDLAEESALKLEASSLASKIGRTGKQVHRVQRLLVGARVCVFGEARRVPSPGGDPSLYREPPTTLTFSGSEDLPVVISESPLSPRSLVARLARLSRYLLQEP